MGDARIRKRLRERHAKVRSDLPSLIRILRMTERLSGTKRNRVKLLQGFTCGAVGLLVAFDVVNMRVPLYCLTLAGDCVGDVLHAVTRLVRHSLLDVLDQFERNAITVADAFYLALSGVLIAAGFVFLRTTWRALAKARPGRWVPLPRLGRRRAALTVLVLGSAMALVWEYGDLPWLAGYLVRLLWLAVKAAYGNRDAIWQAVQAIHENKETIAQIVKGIVSAIATYVTLEIARVVVDFVVSIVHFVLPVVLPLARYGCAGYKYMRQWLPRVEPTRRQRDWLHGAASVAAGSLLGFANLSFPQIPDGLWLASVPGLILFAGQRPSLMLTIGHVGGHMSRYLIHYLRVAIKYTRAHPRGALGIAGGTIVGGVVVGVFDASGAPLGIAIIWGTLKAGYSAAAVASIIAAARGTVEIITHVRQAGSAVATGANAITHTVARRLIALCRNLANAAARLMSHAWSAPPTQEHTSGLRLISAG
jgi:hypothetical protein